MKNQAVIFTKPVHHLRVDIGPDELSCRARDFFTANGFKIVSSRQVDGSELAARKIIRNHYQMYSRASYGDFSITPEGAAVFADLFGRSWDEETENGRIKSNPQLLEQKRIDADYLFECWNAAEARKVQAGLLAAWLAPLDCYGINAFYPAMEANFYHPSTRMDYMVVEFDPAVISWKRFRSEILGSTHAAKAVPESFRGMLYADFRVEYPGRDNFVHGSAGPLEGMIERSIHEPDFNLSGNPVGSYLEAKGITREHLTQWMAQQSCAGLGSLFDATEEKDTATVFPVLDGVDWSVR